MMNEKCAACIHCEVCGFIESETAKDGVCDFYEDGKRWRPIKTGHWRAVYQGDEIIDYRCSECEFGNTFGKGTYGMNYCPNCGAKMVEPQESEG